MKFRFFIVSSDEEFLPDNQPNDSESEQTDENECMDEATNCTQVHNWQDPTGNLFEFPCNKTNAVTEDFLRKLRNNDPISFFFLFIDEEVLSLIVENTNLYAEQEIIKAIVEETISPNSRLQSWIDTDADEIKVFFGVLLWMGLDKKPTISDYWNRDILYTSPASKYMSRNRFELLLKMIHFSDNEKCLPNNKLFKIQPLLDLLNKNFSLMYDAGQSVTIDESMVPFRGRLNFRQYIPTKRHRYGVKILKVCLLSGYTWFAKIYSGKQYTAQDQNMSVTTQITMELMTQLLDEGRTLFTDNFYTSVELAEQLLNRRTHLIGTLRLNRKHNPHCVTKAKLRRGEMKVQQSAKKIIIAKWKDKRDVLFLTTKSLPELKEINCSRGKVVKPSTIIEYNGAKGYIDLSDQMTSYSNTLRRSLKWYRKVAFDFITNTVVVNAHRLYTLTTNDKIKITKFREIITKDLLNHAMPQIAPLPQNTRKHILQENSRSRGRCVLCYSNLSKTLNRKEAQKKIKTSQNKLLGL